MFLFVNNVEFGYVAVVSEVDPFCAEKFALSREAKSPDKIIGVSATVRDEFWCPTVAATCSSNFCSFSRDVDPVVSL